MNNRNPAWTRKSGVLSMKSSALMFSMQMNKLYLIIPLKMTVIIYNICQQQVKSKLLGMKYVIENQDLQNVRS